MEATQRTTDQDGFAFGKVRKCERVSPARLYLAPLFGRPNGLHLEFVSNVLMGLRERLVDLLPGCQVEWLLIQGGADVPGSRSALCREVLSCEWSPGDQVLMLDDDVIPSPKLIAAMLDWQQSKGEEEWATIADRPRIAPPVAADYLPRGYNGSRASTVFPGTVRGLVGGRSLVGAGCLLVELEHLSDVFIASRGYPSTSEVVDGVWLADDYSLIWRLGGAYVFPGVQAQHIASGVPLISASRSNALLDSAGLGKRRTARSEPIVSPATERSRE